MGRTEEFAQTDAYRRSVEATVLVADEDGAVLDATVFYARGGGQPGDTGRLSWDGGSVGVVDTIRRERGGAPSARRPAAGAGRPGSWRRSTGSAGTA